MVAGNLGHSLAYRYITPISVFISTWLSSLCPCPNFPLLIKKLVLGLGPILIEYDLEYDLYLIPSAKTLFPNEVAFTGSGGQDLDISFFRRTQFNP